MEALPDDTKPYAYSLSQSNPALLGSYEDFCAALLEAPAKDPILIAAAIKALGTLSQGDISVKKYQREFLFLVKNAKPISKMFNPYFLMV